MDRLKSYQKKARKILRGWLKRCLALTARLILKKYKPLIIGVTGSVGKTSTKEAIYSALRLTKRVRRSHGNFNSEFGFPLSVLGDYKRSGGWFFWAWTIKKAWIHLILPDFIGQMFFGRYPEILVLEYAADRPGDIKHLMGIASPSIAVITAIGEVPVHVEFYDSPEQVAREKVRLIESLGASNHAILNADDASVKNLAKKTRAVVSTFGFSEGADTRISSFETKFEGSGKRQARKPAGITFKLESGDSFVPVRISGTLGKSQAYAVAAAATVGLRLGLNLVDIADAFTYFQVPGQRVNLTAGKNESFIIDDSYNASPIAMKLALETVSEVQAKRKIGVLGDMLELGNFSDKAHKEVGKLAVKVFGVLITVGPEAKKIASAARAAKMPAKNIFSFDKADEGEEKLLSLIKAGDLVLIKGSKAVGLQKVAEAIRLGKTIK